MAEETKLDCWGEPIPAPPTPKETDTTRTEPEIKAVPSSEDTRSFTERLKELDLSRASQDLTPEQIRANFEKSRQQVKEREKGNAVVEETQTPATGNEPKTEQETTKIPTCPEAGIATTNLLATEPKDPQEVLARVIDTVGNDATCMQREPELTAAVLMLAQALNNMSSAPLSQNGTADKDLPSVPKESTEKQKRPLKKRVLSILFYMLLTCVLTAAILLVLAAVGFEPALGVFEMNT